MGEGQAGVEQARSGEKGDRKPLGAEAEVELARATERFREGAEDIVSGDESVAPRHQVTTGQISAGSVGDDPMEHHPTFVAQDRSNRSDGQGLGASRGDGGQVSGAEEGRHAGSGDPELDRLAFSQSESKSPGDGLGGPSR